MSSSDPAPRVMTRETLALHRRAETRIADATRRLAEAESEAARRLAEADREAAARVAAADEQARGRIELAEAEAHARAAEVEREAAARLAATLRDTERALADFRAAERDALLAVAVHVAGTLVGEIAGSDRRALERALDEAMSRLGGRSTFTVRVSAADAAAATELLGAARVRVDPDLSPADVIVDAAAGRIDARLATRLDALAAALLGEDRP